MANTYFRFKQFTIHQERSAMKVCTDSCILGAWTSKFSSGAESILDIGAGTGLLSLMLAQRSNAQIDAIEYDFSSAIQARENINASPWSERIRLTESDIRSFTFDHSFDWIICNPPFYESDLNSPEQNKNRAKHQLSLTLEELMLAINKNLSQEGIFSILLPFHRSEYFERLAKESGFFLKKKLTVRQSPLHQPFRTIGLYSRNLPASVGIEEMSIKNEEGKNSFEMTALMTDYYL